MQPRIVGVPTQLMFHLGHTNSCAALRLPPVPAAPPLLRGPLDEAAPPTPQQGLSITSPKQRLNLAVNLRQPAQPARRCPNQTPDRVRWPAAAHVMSHVLADARANTL
ncbi:hypothetical protein IF1G_06308 [Cordyceps javanica]|uniref:Uncharacterized protein n=1 Tax=Cordyceps javanica TaxID=43265 RepID=A0A545VUS6_9HYPO|nr:hypothetical protein IF1G_06308 [Cordyceps javanica]TQW05482.1 hypothetical protein IF2G_06604 [Cordyceps javanica]